MIAVHHLQPAASRQDEQLRTARARRGLAIFFTIVIPFSALFEVLIATTGRMDWYLPLMWTPTLAAIVAPGAP